MGLFSTSDFREGLHFSFYKDHLISKKTESSCKLPWLFLNTHRKRMIIFQHLQLTTDLALNTFAGQSPKTSSSKKEWGNEEQIQNFTMWWILVPLSIMANAPPSCQLLWYSLHCKQSMTVLQKHLCHEGSTVPCEGCKVSISLCRRLCSTGNHISISYSNFCIICTAHTAAFDKS